MHRIDGYGAAPGSVFTEGNPATATPATVVTADWMNAVQEELAGVIEGAGIALSKPNNAQLLAAIQSLVVVADGSVTAAKLASVLDLSGKTLTLSAAQRANDYLEYRDEKASGTAGGGFTSGAWQTRTLTTEKSDTGNHGTLSSNQITLAAGTYECEILCPAGVVNAHQARLYNITDSSEAVLGTNVWCGNGSTQYIPSVVAGRFTIAASKVLEVQHRCQTTKATDGFGLATSWGTEVYTVARFWKVG